MVNRNKEGIRYNTSYYRRNKEERFCVNTCPYCDYESTGPKQVIKVHVWSKHTPENERPFQCPHAECNRGFAAKALLHKHLIKKHNINIPKNNKRNILVYEIDDNTTHKINPLPTKYINRLNYYINNKYIPVNNLSYISQSDIYFDNFLGIISLKEHTRSELLARFSTNQ